MIIDKDILQEYPFEGEVYRFGIDESKPLDEQVEEKILILATKCDITALGGSYTNDFITDKFQVSMPIDYKTQSVEIHKGDNFAGNINGLEVNGKIIAILPSQLDAVSFVVQDNDV